MVPVVVETVYNDDKLCLGVKGSEDLVKGVM